MKGLILIIWNSILCQCYGVIYKLNDSDLSRMPPVFHLDDYDHCITDPAGLYCSVDINVVSDTTNQLYTMMQNYSEYTKKHYNHTLLHHGICVTRTCKEFLRKSNTTEWSSSNTANKTSRDSEELRQVLEACLNESLWNDYELKCTVTELYCNKGEDQVRDSGDLAVGVFLLLLLTMNLIGTLYDFFAVRGKNRPGRPIYINLAVSISPTCLLVPVVEAITVQTHTKYHIITSIFDLMCLYKCSGLLLCFSVPRNYSRLITSYANLGPREERLQVFHGLRTLTMMSVIFCHSLLPFALAPENVHYVETLYDNIMYFILLNGTVVVQTFFLISGCLLSYKLELYTEKQEIRWTLLPKLLIVTWAKLTPSYMVILALTTTWLRYAGSGPFWEMAVMNEVKDCRQHGWKNVLYINNYFDHTQCMVQTWYLGANMQLYIMGYGICILAKSGKFRKAVLIFLFIIGILTPMAHTYFQDLDAVLMITPETGRSFMDDPTFNNVYKRGHTNIANFVLGIALGLLIYQLQAKDVDMQKYKKYRYLLLLTFPGIVGTMFIGSVFYMDGSDASVYSKAIYSGLIKPTFGVILAIMIIGCVFKIENVYRVILEWNGWKITGRLSYVAFLLHVGLVRVATGSLRTLVPLANLRMIEVMVAFIVMSYLAAIPFWVLVDAPLTEFLLKVLTGKLNQRIKSIPENNIALKNHLKTTDIEERNARL